MLRLLTLITLMTVAHLGTSQLFWSHYIYIPWKDKPSVFQSRVTESEINNWRQRTAQDHVNASTYLSFLAVYRAFTAAKPGPVSFADERGIKETYINQAKSLLRSGQKFYPVLPMLTPSNEGETVSKLVLNHTSTVIDIQERRSFSYFDTHGHQFPNVMKKQYHDDLDLLDLYFVRHTSFFNELSGAGVLSQRAMGLRLHDLLMRMTALQYQTNGFRDHNPDREESILQLTSGYLPSKLFSPKSMVDLMCDVGNRFKFYYTHEIPCDDWAKHLTHRGAQLIFDENQLLVKISFPVASTGRRTMTRSANSSKHISVKGTSQQPYADWGTFFAGLFLTIAYSVYTSFVYVFFLLGVLSTLRDDSWAYALGTAVLMLPTPGQALTEEFYDFVHFDTAMPIVEVTFECIIIVVLTTILLTRFCRRVEIKRYAGYEINGGARGKIAEFRLYIQFIYKMNSLWKTQIQNISVYTQLRGRQLPTDCNTIRINTPLHNWVIINKFGRKALKLVQPVMLESVNNCGNTTYDFDYDIEIPLTDISWGASGLPHGLERHVFGVAFVTLMRSSSFVILDSPRYATPTVPRPVASERPKPGDSTELRRRDLPRLPLVPSEQMEMKVLNTGGHQLTVAAEIALPPTAVASRESPDPDLIEVLEKGYAAVT